MKHTILLSLILAALGLTGCVQSTVTRVREDGAKEVIVTKGLSDPARDVTVRLGDRLLDRYLGPDVETRSSK
jgi:hypothetical protein